MSNRRDLLILGVLFAALFLFIALGPARQGDESQSVTPTTYSVGPTGTQALLRWSQDLGYDAQRLEYRPFSLGEEDRALFVFNPSVPFNRTDAGELLRWVEAGGTLVLVDSQAGFFSGSDAVLQELKAEMRPVTGDDSSIQRAAPAQPIFDRPPIGPVEVRADRAIDMERQDYAQLLGTDENPLLVGIQQGEGYVYLATTLHPFTNEGLRDTNNAALVLNLLQRLPEGGRILFDEYHHGYFTPPSLRSVVVSQPWGWGLLFALGALGLYLALSGRRFGRPVPLREEVALRSSAEYVESMADLFQRGGKREYIGLHYHTALKRRLAKPFGINPRLEDDEFIRELGRYRALDAAQLAAVLATLRRRGLQEAELVQTVAVADSIPAR